MIKRVYRSKFDIENLSRLRTSIPVGIDNFNYKNIVVAKPWGYEYLMFENPYVAIWVLYIKKNHSTSMHCHPNKKSSLVVLFGEVVCANLEGWVKRSESQGLIIDEAAFHSTKAISDEGAIIMEIESPPNKKDLVRLKDEYGRKRQGYEDVSKMTKEVLDYEYVDFHDLNLRSRNVRKIRSCQIALCINKNTQDIHSKLKKESASIICLLQGKFHDIEGNIVLGTGEVASYAELSKKQLVVFGNIIYLALSYDKSKSS